MRGHDDVSIPVSKLKGQILRVLKAEGFIGNFVEDTKDAHPAFRVRLRYVTEGQLMITGMRRISKPGLRVYVGKRKVPRVRGGMGISILSTSQGIMTDKESRAAGIGGEVLCQVW